MCQYKGYTYVGRIGFGVDRIDEGGNVTSSFIKLAGCVTGIVAYEDTLYTLTRGVWCMVYVHDLADQQLHSWEHEDRSGSLGRSLAIIKNEVIIADRTNKRFTIYTLTGERVRDVPCDLITQKHLTVCHVGYKAVLVANRDAKPGLYRVNLTTGDVVWRSDRVDSPVGIAMHSKEVALVTSYNDSKQVEIWIINADTGKKFALFRCLYLYSNYELSQTVILDENHHLIVSLCSMET